MAPPPPKDSAAPVMVIQSHRGAGELAAENTVPAYELAWSLGTVPEADIRAAADGTLVAIHDDNFARLVKNADAVLAARNVGDLTWEELSGLDVGSWKGDAFAGQRIPRVEDLCALLKDHPARQMYFDLKTAGLRELARMIQAHGVGPQVIVATPDYDVIRAWRGLVPDGGTLLWMRTQDQPGTVPIQERLGILRAHRFEGISQIQLHVWLQTSAPEIRRDSIDPFLPPDHVLRAAADDFRRAGVLFQALPWNVTALEVYWKLMDLGVQSFATDHPLATLQAVREYRPLPA